MRSLPVLVFAAVVALSTSAVAAPVLTSVTPAAVTPAPEPAGGVLAGPEAEPEPGDAAEGPVAEESASRRSLVLSAAGTVGVYATLCGWVSLAWFVRTTDSPTFHLHDEGWFGRNTYAGGADKFGHGWGNYAMTRGVSQILQYGGWPRRGSIAAAGTLSLGFFTFSEIKDGYKVEYGFSYGDMIANATGVAVGVLMELVPELDRRFDVHISYLPSGDYLDRLEEDGPFNTPEDYTGQTFLVSYHLGSSDAVLRRASWARFVDATIGYRAVNYKPVPSDGSERSQELFLGVSLNLQAMIDSMTGRGAGAGVLHFVTEIYQAPYTTLRVGGFDRVSPAVMLETP